jgi:hypothetical protein
MIAAISGFTLIQIKRCRSRSGTLRRLISYAIGAPDIA